MKTKKSLVAAAKAKIKSSKLLQVLFFSIAMYIFLLGIKVMGTSFKLMGTGFSETLLSITSNPFVGLVIGILATSVVQSSSVTTSIVVGITAAGGLTIGGAIPIIMGANIGTSVTNTLVSLGHSIKNAEFKRAFSAATIHDFFNLFAILILFPLEMIFHFIERSATFLATHAVDAGIGGGFSSPLSMILSPFVDAIKSLLSSSPLIMLGLSIFLIVGALRMLIVVLKPLVKSKITQSLRQHVFDKPLRSGVFGFLLTAFVQSSSVTTSVIVPFVALGMLSVESIFPFIIGANLGTTLTALMASLVSGSLAAIAVAFSHVIINLLGSLIIYPLRHIPLAASRRLGELASTSRSVAVAYVATVFFIIPGIIVYMVT